MRLYTNTNLQFFLMFLQEISLSHVKDLVKNSSEGESTAQVPGIQEKKHVALLSQLPLADLTKVLKEIILHERDLTEQDTIGKSN